MFSSINWNLAVNNILLRSCIWKNRKTEKKLKQYNETCVKKISIVRFRNLYRNTLRSRIEKKQKYREICRWTLGGVHGVSMAWERETKIKRNSCKREWEEDEAFECVKVKMRDEKLERERRSLRERIEFVFESEKRGKRSGGIRGESGKRKNWIFFWSVKMMRVWHVSFFLFVDKIFWIEVCDI